MTVLVALGGNALLLRGQKPDPDAQKANIGVAARALAALAREHPLVVTHGNGPQVGLLAMQAETGGQGRPFPLDVLGAETEGMIGYMLETALRNELPARDIATLLTQVVVDEDDPAFVAPSKPIGAVFDEATARRLAAERGWSIAPDGDGFRRVVPSPLPRDFIEISTIRLLVGHGVLVICAGGGGIPVTQAGAGWRGVEAVVDKDLSSALLARQIGAGMLLMLTDVEGVRTGWGTPEERALAEVSPDMIEYRDFAAGSMGPKVRAAVEFVEATGATAAVGRLADAPAILSGEAGTRFLAGRGIRRWAE